MGRETELLEEVGAYTRESPHLLLTQLGEEDLPVLTQDARKHADLPALLQGDEVSPDIAGSHQWLTVHHPVQEAQRKRPVGEGDVGEPGRGHLEVGGVGHYQVLHDTFARSHDVDRVGGLVGRDAEKVTRRNLTQQLEQDPGLDDVVPQQRLNGIAVLLAAHVLVGREVGHDVEAPVLAEDAPEDGVGEIQSVGQVGLRNGQTLRGAQVACELGQSVLVQVHHNKLGGVEPQDRADERRADRARAPYDEHAPALNLGSQPFPVGLDVREEQALLTLYDMVLGELFYIW